MTRARAGSPSSAKASLDALSSGVPLADALASRLSRASLKASYPSCTQPRA